MQVGVPGRRSYGPRCSRALALQEEGNLTDPLMCSDIADDLGATPCSPSNKD